MLLELLIAAITALFVWDYLHKRRHNEFFNKYHINGPKAYPILGSAIEMRNIKPENFIDFVREGSQKYGKIFRVWVLHQHNVILTDIKHFEAVLQSQQMIKKSLGYDILFEWLGTGLLLSNGKKWHKRRKIITPTFHFKILEQFVEIFDQQSKKLVHGLRAKADGKTAFNIFPIVCLCALDVIAETAMGVKVHAQENENNQYVQAVATAARIIATRFLKPTYRTNWLFRLTAPQVAQDLKNAITVMHKFTNDVIEKRRQTLNASKASEDTTNELEDNDVGLKRRMALLDVLLQSTVDGKALSNDDIREEVDTFMFEGHDTTTSGISYCLYLLSRHSEVQQKLFEEIRTVLGDDGINKSVTLRELQEMKYLECVIKESMRLYPPVPGIGREITEDAQLADIMLPAHTNIGLNFFIAMRDPDYFDNPNAFIPERFANESLEKINPFAYVPFSAGPRNCIGQKFAMLELKSTVSKVVRHYELLPLGPEPQPMVNLILRSANGVHLGLKPRKG